MQFAERRLPSQKHISALALVVQRPAHPSLDRAMTPRGVRTGRNTDLVEVVDGEIRDAAVQRGKRERLAGRTRAENQEEHTPNLSVSGEDGPLGQCPLA